MTPSNATPELPLCSFGPGGSYIVDWQVNTADLARHPRLYPPRTLGSIVGRVTGALLWDLKEWLIASHPRRAFRADHCPAALDPCGACGISSIWPRWFAEGRQAPPLIFDPAETGLVEAKPRDTEDAPANYPFSAAFESQDLEPVAEFSQSPAGRLIARLSAESRSPGTLRLFDDTPSQAFSNPETLEGGEGARLLDCRPTYGDLS